MLLYLNYPSWIHPEIFPGVKFLGLIRWYGLMYCFAFLTAYFVLKKVAKEGALDTKNYKLKEDDLFSFITTGIVFLLIGARIFSTLIYDTSGVYYVHVYGNMDDEDMTFIGEAKVYVDKGGSS